MKEEYPPWVERAIREAQWTDGEPQKRAVKGPTKPSVASKVKAKGKLPESGMNGLEAKFAAILEARKCAGEILWWLFQPLSLNMGKGAKYRPDFATLEANGDFVLWETKGFWREAAKVRIKVAAARFPFRFVIVKWNKQDGWTYEDV